jgi:hypothetical protein
MRLSLATVFAFTLLIPSAAHAFCRTTTQQLPQNYNPVNGCFTDGNVLFWRNQCVGYSINQAASRTIAYDDAKRIIDLSFDTWMNVSCKDSGAAPGIAASDLGAAECDEVRYNSDSANQNLIVFRDDSWPYKDAYSTLGLTTVTFNADTGEIYDADMEINSSERNLSITDRVPANGFDLRSVITHEAGHFFGLAHATSSSSTMYASYKPGTTALRTLSQDDIDGICTIYPTDMVRTVSAALSVDQTIAADSCNPTPRRGLTSACVEPKKDDGKCNASSAPAAPWGISGTAAVGLAAVLVARRRRRQA